MVPIQEQPILNGQNESFVPPQIDNSQMAVDNPTMTPMTSNTEAVMSQSTQAVLQSEMSTVQATTTSSNSTPDKAIPPVDALSSRATESANLTDSKASYQPVNTQLSVLLAALSCSIFYLIQ
jgi:hypothetical protein